MGMKISSVSGYSINSKYKNIVSKTTKAIAKKAETKMMDLKSLALLLPASAFLNKTDETLYCDDYVNISGQWYKEHYPMDGSDYYHIIPCDDPYKKPTYIPGS